MNKFPNAQIYFLFLAGCCFFITPESLYAQSLPDTLWLDVSEEAPAQTTYSLRDRFVYKIVIDGTFSVWDSWGGGSCGDFQGVPRYPSPTVLNGPTGVDPAYIFSAPITTPFCSKILPTASGDFKISTDGGQTYFNPRPVEDFYNSEHAYTYEIQGEGQPLLAFMDDEPYEDNYGLLRFVIESATPVSVEDELPGNKGVVLLGNYPNPAQGQTQIKFRLNRPEVIQLEIYDLLGRVQVSRPYTAMTTGEHHVKVETTSLMNGVYFYRLSSQSEVETGSLIVTN